ncbi:MAG: hypothetical protein RI996_598 [Candidatus Parcubacteria bacterium]|jgi:hypothetical protein
MKETLKKINLKLVGIIVVSFVLGAGVTYFAGANKRMHKDMDSYRGLKMESGEYRNKDMMKGEMMGDEMMGGDMMKGDMVDSGQASATATEPSSMDKETTLLNQNKR